MEAARAGVVGTVRRAHDMARHKAERMQATKPAEQGEARMGLVSVGLMRVGSRDAWNPGRQRESEETGGGCPTVVEGRTMLP